MSDSKNLTTGPVLQNLTRLVLPMIFGIVAILSVSLVDTYFVGRLGTNALAALSFTFPITLMITSISIGLSAGAASLVSRAIGGNNLRDAMRLSTDSLVLAVFIVVIISVIGYLTIEPLFRLMGAQGETLTMIVRYMQVWYYSMPFLVVPMVANAIIRAAGDAFWPSIIMIGAAAVNIATTPLLIFGYGPVPALDIEGAAWGTFIAHFSTLIFALYILFFKEKLLALNIPNPKEVVFSWWRILKIGLPASLGSATNPIGIAIVTSLISAMGADTVAAFGVATRVESFAAIPMLALSSAIGPMVGQNWGAKKKDRTLKSIQLAYAICCVWALLLAIIFWIFASPISHLFASDTSVAQDAQQYLYIVPITLWGYGITIVAAGAYNSLGKSVTGLAYYLVRTMVLYVPLSWAASMLSGSEKIYYAISISNVIAGISIGLHSLYWLKNAKA